MTTRFLLASTALTLGLLLSACGDKKDAAPQPTSTTTSTDLAVTTIVPLNTTTTTLPSHPRLLPHLRPPSGRTRQSPS